MSVRPLAWQVGNGKPVRPLSASAPDLERNLETWIEQDSSILADDLLIIGRQITTNLGGFIDLLALDGTGNLVVVELKRNLAFREAIAQALEYAAWCSKLGYDEVVKVAEARFPTAEALENAFRDRFDEELPESINQTQRILIVAPEITDAAQTVIEYLSDTFSVPINAISFGMFGVGAEQILVRNAVLPEEVANAKRPAGAKTKPAPSMDEFFERAKAAGFGEALDVIWELHPYFIAPWRYSYNFAFALPDPNKKGRYVSAFTVWISSEAITISMKPQNLCDLFAVPMEKVAAFVKRMQKEVGKESTGWKSGWSAWLITTPAQARQFVNEFIALTGIREPAQ